MCLELPSAPGLALDEQMDPSSLTFILTPPTTSPQCATEYIINATSSNGSIVTTVPASEVGAPITVGGLDLCAETYSFTAHVVSGAGNGPTSDVIVQNATDPGKFSVYCYFMQHAFTSIIIDIAMLQPNISAISDSSNITVSWQVSRLS